MSPTRIARLTEDLDSEVCTPLRTRHQNLERRCSKAAMFKQCFSLTRTRAFHIRFPFAIRLAYCTFLCGSLLVHVARPSVCIIASHPLALLLGNVVLLLEQVALDLGVLELLQIPVCANKRVSKVHNLTYHWHHTDPAGLCFCFFHFRHPHAIPPASHRNSKSLTSQVPTLLQVVHALPVVALAQLLPHQPRHHALHPLLPDHGVLRGFQRLVVVVVDAVERRGHRRLGRFEHLGLGSGHCRGFWREGVSERSRGVCGVRRGWFVCVSLAE